MASNDTTSPRATVPGENTATTEEIIRAQTAAEQQATPPTPATQVGPSQTTNLNTGADDEDDPDFHAGSVRSFTSGGAMPTMPTPPVMFPSPVRTLPPGPQQVQPNPFYGALQGSTTKNVENVSTVTVARDISQEALIRAAVQTAVTCHATDPMAAGQAANEAIRQVLEGLRKTSGYEPSPNIYGEVGNAMTRDRAPASQNSKAAEAILLGSITSATGHNDKHKDPTRLYRSFPVFPGDKCRYEPDLWKTFWEEVATFKTVTDCSDEFIAVMIKDQADRNKNTELHSSIYHLRHSDGTFKEAGYAGVLKCITEDFAPKGHTLKVKTRERVMKHMYRKFKENPKWWFRRADEWIQEAKDQDPDFSLSADQLAEMWLHHSGLSNEEKKEVFKLSGYEHDPAKIRANILQEFENARELDQRRVMKGRLNQKLRRDGRPNKVYKVACSETGELGTDLTPEDVEEYDEFADLDPTVKVFDPSNPVLLTTVTEGEYQNNTQDDDGYEDEYNDDEGPSQACEVLYTDSPYPDDDYVDEEEDEEEDSDESGSETESSGDEQDIKDDIATNLFIRGYEHGRDISGFAVTEEEAAKKAEVFVTNLRDSRKVTVKTSEKRKSTKGGPRGSNRGRKSDGHFKPKKAGQRNKDGYQKPKKGARRMLSTTRGYTPTTTGKTTEVKFEGGIPFDPTHTKLECRVCNNKDAGGNKVLGHLPGAPICPMVRNGTKTLHPRWAEICKQKNIKLAKPTGSKPPGKGGGKGGKGGSRGSDGKFQSRGLTYPELRSRTSSKPQQIFMMNSTSAPTTEFHDATSFNQLALLKPTTTAPTPMGPPQVLAPPLGLPPLVSKIGPPRPTCSIVEKWDLLYALQGQAAFLLPKELNAKQSKNLISLNAEDTLRHYGTQWGSWTP